MEKDRAGIVLTERAVSRLAKAIKAPLPNLEAVPGGRERNGADQPTRKKLTISRIPMNPRIVLAYDEHGAEQIVDVGKNKTFAIGDEIEVTIHDAQKGVWQCLSPIPRDLRRPIRL